MFDFLKQIGKSDVEIIEEKLGVEICRRADIGALVLESISQFGELYSIDLKILDIETNEQLYTTNVQSDGKRSIPGLIDEISKQTRISLAERAEEVEKNQREIASLTTKNLEAYKYFDLGEKAMYSLKWAQAREYFHKAIRIKPNFAEAFHSLGTANERLGNKQESLKNYQEALKIKPDYAEVFDSMGTVLSDLARYDESIKSFNKAIEFIEKTKMTIVNRAFVSSCLGYVYFLKKDYNSAIKFFKNAIKIMEDIDYNVSGEKSPS